MIVEWIKKGKPTVIGICSGAVAVWWPLPGLWARPVRWARSGSYRGRPRVLLAAALGACSLRRRADAFGVHAVGGATGAIHRRVCCPSTAATRACSGQCNAGRELAIGVGVVFIYDCIVTLISAS
jgi:Amt family ammonium transporter